MDETIQQIETHIDRTRDELGSHLRELEARVSAATDWREYVRARPYTTLAAAMTGGLVLATVLTKKGHPRRFRAPESTQSRSSIPIEVSTVCSPCRSRLRVSSTRRWLSKTG